jgi:predicted DNA-binding transcriptional regulator AlpA
MPLGIGGLEYMTAAEVCDLIGISRQTLWRWRQDTRIPPGLRFRGKRLVFSQDEVEQIRNFASSLEPAGTPYPTQLGLFRAAAGRDK